MLPAFEDSNITEPTYRGFVETTYDALLLFDAVQRGVVRRIPRRLNDKERHLIDSGSVFIFDEVESGMKRWTDNILWSPSRILGNFLIYRELSKKGDSSKSAKKRDVTAEDDFGDAATGVARERALLGSLGSNYLFKDSGLMKKTISVHNLRLICYYRPEDVHEGRLRHPSSLIEFTSFEISENLLTGHSWRVPPNVQRGPDGHWKFIGEVAESSVEVDSAATLTPFMSLQHEILPSERSISLVPGYPRRNSSGERLHSPTSSNVRLAANTPPFEYPPSTGVPSGSLSPYYGQSTERRASGKQGLTVTTSGRTTPVRPISRYDPYARVPSAVGDMQHYTMASQYAPISATEYRPPNWPPSQGSSQARISTGKLSPSLVYTTQEASSYFGSAVTGDGQHNALEYDRASYPLARHSPAPRHRELPVLHGPPQNVSAYQIQPVEPFPLPGLVDSQPQERRSSISPVYSYVSLPQQPTSYFPAQAEVLPTSSDVRYAVPNDRPVYYLNSAQSLSPQNDQALQLYPSHASGLVSAAHYPPATSGQSFGDHASLDSASLWPPVTSG